MAADARQIPRSVKAPHGASVFEITWADGHQCSYPHDILRGYCPCAGCQGHSGVIRYISGANLELRELEPVGNYALSLTWGDGHSSGIYTFRFLRGLCDLLEERGADAVRALEQLPSL